MNILIHAVKFDANKLLIEFVESKLSKLERFEDKITTAEVFLKLDKDDEHGNKVVNVVLTVPGGKLDAETRSHTYEKAVDEAVDALKKQIEKYKSKSE